MKTLFRNSQAFDDKIEIINRSNNSCEKMSNKRKWVNNGLIKELETTEEYKSWLNSLFAIIGYISSSKLDDLNLILELIADHLSASVDLQKGLKIAKDKS